MSVRIPQLPRTGTGAVDRALDAIRVSFEHLSNAYVFLDGSYVTHTAAGGAAENVMHGLGRPARGLFVLGVERASGSTACDIPFFVTGSTVYDNFSSTYFPHSGTYRLWVW